MMMHDALKGATKVDSFLGRSPIADSCYITARMQSAISRRLAADLGGTRLGQQGISDLSAGQRSLTICTRRGVGIWRIQCNM